MTSLTDIPINLRTPPDKLAFITWLAKIPIHYYHKLRLASLWQLDTGRKVTHADCNILEYSPQTLRPPNAPTLPPPTTRR